MRSPITKKSSSFQESEPTPSTTLYNGDDPKLDDLDDGFPYQFNNGNVVWVRELDEWVPAVVGGGKVKTGPTRMSTGEFYPVFISVSPPNNNNNNDTPPSPDTSDSESMPAAGRKERKIRKYFAPLNGEIKPDSPHVTELLKEAGWV